MKRDIIFIYLFAAAGSLALYYLFTSLFDLNVSSPMMIIIGFFAGFHLLFIALNIPDKIIRHSIKKELEINKEVYDSQIKQMLRKEKFQSAFDTSEDKERKERDSAEAEMFNDNYESAKKSFLNKKLSEMNNFEKFHFYKKKLSKYNKLTDLTSSIVIFIITFVFMFAEEFLQFIQFQFIVLGIVSLSLFPIISLILYLRIRKKYNQISKTIFPEEFVKQVDELLNKTLKDH